MRAYRAKRRGETDGWALREGSPLNIYVRMQARIFWLEREHEPRQKTLNVGPANMNGWCATYAIVSVPPRTTSTTKHGQQLDPDIRLTRTRVENTRGVKPSTSEVDKIRLLITDECEIHHGSRNR